MNADVKESLEQINISWRAFEHKGKRMTKIQVRKVLKYALARGYKTTDELSEKEVDKILKDLEDNLRG